MIKPPIDEMIKHIIKVCLLIVENFMLQRIPLIHTFKTNTAL